MRRLLPLALVSAALVIGCKSVDPEKEVQGSWTVSNITSTKTTNAQTQQAMNMMKSATFDIGADHKFKSTVMTVPIEGDWTMSGRTLTLQPKTMMGKSLADIKKQLSAAGQGKMADQVGASTVLTLKDDNKTLVASKDGTELTLTKK